MIWTIENFDFDQDAEMKAYIEQMEGDGHTTAFIISTNSGIKVFHKKAA